jgi:hypothetical protein
MTKRACLFLVCVVPVSAETASDVECTGCVGSSDIMDGGVKPRDIAAEAVTAGKIKNGAINSRKLAGGAVTTDKLLDGAVGYEKLGSDVQYMISNGSGQRRMKLIDANQMVVGDIADIDVYQFPTTQALVLVDVGDETVPMLVRDAKIIARDDSELRFSSNDCSGAPFVTSKPEALIDLLAVAVTADGRVWKAVPDTIAERFLGSRYYQALGECRMVSELMMTSRSSEIGTLPEYIPPYKVVYE